MRSLARAIARHRVIVVAVTLGLLLALFYVESPVARGQAPSPSPTLTSDAAAGKELFGDTCASCHGSTGGGTNFGPSLVGVGAASADFMLRTGRMPLADPAEQAVREPPVFNDEQIRQLDAYVASLGIGPGIPPADLRGTSLPSGQQLFTINCAPCHGVTGSGDAIGGPAFAPSLSQATPVQVAEAVITGPGQMPKFGFSDTDRNDLVRYVNYLHQQASPGGWDLGFMGPVPEGFVAWFLGMGLILILLVAFIARSHEPGGGDTDGEER